jgi:GNAT superfamily N-acetyltransferase
MTVTLVRTIGGLPTEFAALEADAKADGHAHLTRLSGEFAKDPAMFHAIFTAYIDGELAGIGATTDEPTVTSQPTWRMRRLYVHRKFRRQKIAYAIATALLQEAAKEVRAVTVHAGSDEAAQFWEAIGFRRVNGGSWSHERVIPSATLCV